jgi:group I intron endonuclease
VIGIYRIRCIVSGRSYIGSSNHINRRWAQHRSSLRKGSHHSAALQRAWNKYGESSFEFAIIELCSVAELPAREEHWIAVDGTWHDGYNCSPHYLGFTGSVMSEEAKQRLRVLQKELSARPGESERRSAKAKKQLAEGKWGHSTWKGPRNYPEHERRRQSELANRLWAEGRIPPASEELRRARSERAKAQWSRGNIGRKKRIAEEPNIEGT